MNAAPEQPTLGADPSTRIMDLAHYTGDYVRAWSALFSDEAQLARICVNRLLFATVWVCFLVFGVVVCGNLLIATLFERWLHDWASAMAATILLDFVTMLAVLLAMRAWWRNLSMPRSRRALRELMQRLDETGRAGATH